MTEVDLQPRHGKHNVPYGYFILILSTIFIVYRASLKLIFLKRWNITNSPNGVLSKLANHKYKTTIEVITWGLIVFFTCGFHITDLKQQYLTVGKRYGRVAYALIPLNVSLILRPSNIIWFQFGYYLENLNLHKWISRIIVVCSLIHSISFLIHWYVERAEISMWDRSLKLLNFLGIFTMVSLIILTVVSLRYIRRMNYDLFYIYHNLTSFFMIVLISFHARPGVNILTLISLMLILYQVYNKFQCVKASMPKVISSKKSSLEIIKLDLSLDSLPGSHIRLNYDLKNWKSWIFPSHPFSIVNSNQIMLIVRKPNKFRFDMESLSISGPYPSLPPPFFQSVKCGNIICGGSGISYGLPIYQYLKREQIKTKLVWCTRYKSDLHIMNHVDLTGVDIYITSIENEQKEQEEMEEEDGMLLQEEVELQSINKSNYTLGRPNLDQVFDEVELESQKNSWVIGCGPSSLINHAKTWAKAHNFQFYNEKYEM